MSAGLFKRSLAFLIDGFIYLSLTFWIFSFIAAPIYQRQYEDFEMHWNVYDEVMDKVDEDMKEHEERYENNEITYAQLLEKRAEIFDGYYQDPQFTESIDIALGFRDYTLFSSFSIYVLVSYLSILILKGQTIGRRLLKLRLIGEVNWLSLLLREVVWKYIFWVITLGLGFLIDILMIFLSNNNSALRDRLSKTRVVLDDVTYPF